MREDLYKLELIDAEKDTVLEVDYVVSTNALKASKEFYKKLKNVDKHKYIEFPSVSITNLGDVNVIHKVILEYKETPKRIQ